MKIRRCFSFSETYQSIQHIHYLVFYHLHFFFLSSLKTKTNNLYHDTHSFISDQGKTKVPNLTVLRSQKVKILYLSTYSTYLPHLPHLLTLSSLTLNLERCKKWKNEKTTKILIFSIWNFEIWREEKEIKRPPYKSREGYALIYEETNIILMRCSAVIEHQDTGTPDLRIIIWIV